VQKFGIDIDPQIIRGILPALRSLDDNTLLSIFARKFLDAGLPSSQFSFKENMIQYCNQIDGQKLEIGPFDRPLLRGPNVEYFDILNTEQLKARAREHGRQPDNVPEINHVNSEGDLSEISSKFDVAISSHCIEHSPDLISHLKQVADLLKSGGSYYLVIPDRRYCFDHYIKDSTIADILSAHIETRKSPKAKSVIEHRALLTHNDSIRHWLDDHGVSNSENRVNGARAALAEYLGTPDYIDVHCWQFTPQSLLDCCRELWELGYLPFSKVRVSLTPFGRKDFTAIMTRE
jgi:SAM-dependent methyltransferase